MPSPDAPYWWADVQQDRADLGGAREAESWLDEEVDFVPRRRFARSGTDRGTSQSRVLVSTAEVVGSLQRESGGGTDSGLGALDPLHGTFVHAESASMAVARREPPASRTVTVTGNPGGMSAAITRRRPPRTTTDRIGHRPDRIVLWAVLLGAVLIILAITSADSHAAAHAATALQSR
jgi:hypothetical protein